MTPQGKQTLTNEELQTLEALLAKVSGPGADLPWPLFRFITEVTATTNVDLLVRDPAKGVLLAWRDDPFGTGWHVPGSIIRHREEVTHRIAACALDEFGCSVDADERPVALIQIFDDRGHSVSLCFLASLLGPPGKRVLSEDEVPEPGDLRWFSTLSDNLYPSHLVYRDLLFALDRGELGEGARVFTQHVGRRDAAQTSLEGEIASDASLI
jgi:ADP-ribose pyrophosphatase YjhB (NUDIX family)